MKPFIVDVAGIIQDLGAQVSLDDDVELPDLQSGDTLFVPSGDAHIEASVTNAGDGVVLHGSVRARLNSECVRCLEAFTLEVTASLEGLYTSREKATELPEDQEWYPLHHGTIDIAPAIESAIRLELPFAPLHAADCKGICPVCGCNRNSVECSCAAQPGEPGPFDGLKGMFSEENDAE